jgi:hypothetical protein
MGEIAIPEIQRPFVWEPVKVRNLFDSLYSGYPIGYLISWRNPNVRLKDGTTSAGKRILIDGQQRITALMAGLLGQEVLTKDYKTTRIRIAFHPVDEKFEVANPAIRKDPAWISDIADVFAPGTGFLQIANAYIAANPGADKNRTFNTLERLRNITNNQVGVIELAEDLDIETVTKIFIRVNSAGAQLSQADFAMSKIAANSSYGGAQLRKAIDYFCHLATAPDFASKIEQNDPGFMETEFWPKIRWLTDTNDDLYEPSYTDMLRVAFTSRSRRGRLQDLVALLSGRNFETKEYEEAIAEKSFADLKEGVLDFVNEAHFKRFTMILRAAGLVTNDLIGSQNAVNFAYIIYLRGRTEGMAQDDLARLVRRWYAMSVLRGRYAGSLESTFDGDIRQIGTQGLAKYAAAVLEVELPRSFWTSNLPLLMETALSTSPYFLAYKAAQAKLGDKGFLSRDIKVYDLLRNRTDVHHIFPRYHLQKQGLARGGYNQIANFALTQSEINIQIGAKAPLVYFAELREQVSGGPKRYGGIDCEAELRANLAQNCVPAALLDNAAMDYGDFLVERRRLMALKIKMWFDGL